MSADKAISTQMSNDIGQELVSPNSPYMKREVAQVLSMLMLNDNNVGWTSRESGVPQSTIRSWRRTYLEVADEDITDLHKEIYELMQTSGTKQIQDSYEIADVGKTILLTNLKRIKDAQRKDKKYILKPNEATMVNTIAGTWQDKGDRGMGKPTTIVENKTASIEEAEANFEKWLPQMIEASIMRIKELDTTEDSIVEAEVVEETNN
jgi:transposase-like protein